MINFGWQGFMKLASWTFTSFQKKTTIIETPDSHSHNYEIDNQSKY
jgi:hypothetical protein